MTTDQYVEYLVNHARGAAYPAGNTEDFENGNILIPDARVLRLYDRTLVDAFALRQRLFGKSANLRATCDLLLPSLIAGEIPVAAIDNLPEGTLT